MDNVVELGSKQPKKKGSAPRRPRRRRTKSALVLGGGGMTGAVYEIGALRALDLLSVNRTVNEFDVYVGTSAGSLVGALLANGVTPEEMMRAINQQAPTPFRDISLTQLLRPNLGGALKKGALLPLKVAQVARELAPRIGQISVMDVALGLAEGLPTGLYTGSGIERYVARVLRDDPDRTDDFRELERELYIAATDLDTCERVVFGQDDWDDVPISTAVRASTALPMVYTPVTVRDHELVDGSLVSTTNLDLAVEAGATLVFVINPLVPYVNDFTVARAGMFGSRPRHVSDMGLPQIGYQMFKLMAHQRLHEMAKKWEQRYKGVDIVLIEPAPDDQLMFQTSIMNFSDRVAVARHGFESVTVKLASEYEQLSETCSRHGLEMSPTRVNKVVRHFGAQGAPPTRAWRKILEQTTGAVLRQSRAD